MDFLAADRLILQDHKRRRQCATLIGINAASVACTKLATCRLAFRGRDASRRARARRDNQMLDVLMLALGLGFFAASLAYTAACDRI
jgi:hypothetical protein